MVTRIIGRLCKNNLINKILVNKKIRSFLVVYLYILFNICYFLDGKCYGGSKYEYFISNQEKVEKVNKNNKF